MTAGTSWYIAPLLRAAGYAARDTWFKKGALGNAPSAVDIAVGRVVLHTLPRLDTWCEPKGRHGARGGSEHQD